MLATITIIVHPTEVVAESDIIRQEITIDLTVQEMGTMKEEEILFQEAMEAEGTADIKIKRGFRASFYFT